VIDTAV